MRHRISLAINCLHVSAAIYMFVGFGFLIYVLLLEGGADLFVFGALMFVLNLLLVAGIEFVVKGLRRRRFWAWVAGLCIFGVYTCSIFLPLGVLGLWGLLDRGSRSEFGISVQEAAV